MLNLSSTKKNNLEANLEHNLAKVLPVNEKK